MLKLIKRLSKHSALAIAIIITGIIAFLSLKKLKGGTIQVVHLDKVSHTIAYCFLALSWFLFLLKAKLTSKKKLITILCISYGIVIEVLQGTVTTYRTFDLLDVLANTVGIFLGMLIFNQLFEKNQSI